jgi:hypothetical protein
VSFGPAERGEGPETRAEPGIEHVLFLDVVRGLLREVLAARDGELGHHDRVVRGAEDHLEELRPRDARGARAGGLRVVALLLAVAIDDEVELGGVVVDRDAVTPPELPRHAPVADVRHEVVPGLLPVLGQDARGGLLAGDERERVRREALGLHEELPR